MAKVVPVSEKNTVPKGFKNVGNTCYANAALQCLLSTALSHVLLDTRNSMIFRRYSSNPNILLAGSGSVDSQDNEKTNTNKTNNNSNTKNNDKNNDTCEWLTHELTDITRQYTLSSSIPEPEPPSPSLWCLLSSSNNSSHADRNVVDPGKLTRHVSKLSPCLHPYQQEDAHEFLRALLSTLTLDGHNKKLSSLFDGLLESAVTCQTCRHASMTRDRYMDLSLDISSTKVTDLPAALKHFTKTEHLGSDNQVHCDKCGTKRLVTKGLRLATAPTILVCHFKRFSYDAYGRTLRLNKFVGYPQRLEIGPYMSRANRGTPPPYELIGILVHTGRTCHSGHYIAYIKQCGTNNWYQCNDSVVQPVSLETVLDQKAYICIYEVENMRLNHGLQNYSQYQPRHDVSHLNFGEDKDDSWDVMNDSVDSVAVDDFDGMMRSDIRNTSLDMLRHTQHNVYTLDPSSEESSEDDAKSLPVAAPEENPQVTVEPPPPPPTYSNFYQIFQACGLGDSFFFTSDSPCCPSKPMEKGDCSTPLQEQQHHYCDGHKDDPDKMSPQQQTPSDSVQLPPRKKLGRSLSSTNLSQVELEAAKAYQYVTPPTSRDGTPVRPYTSTANQLLNNLSTPNKKNQLSPTNPLLNKRIRPRSRSRGANKPPLSSSTTATTSTKQRSQSAGNMLR